MIKKILLLIFCFFVMIQNAFASDVFKITSVNLDTSNFMLFLSSPDYSSESAFKTIKLVKLANPSRVYFDINSGDVKQIKINQFSKNPNKVRIVLFLKEGFDYRKINFLRVNNNLIIRLKNVLPKSNYFSEIYRDQGYMSGDFAENTKFSTTDFEAKSPQTTAQQNDVLQQIQYAFSASPDKIESSAIKRIDNFGTKELKLLSGAFINDVEQNSNGFLLKSTGQLCVQKPVYGTNKVTFDLPNATLDKGFENKTFTIGKEETVSVQKYTVNKVRVTISSPNAEKFLPIFSADAQSILFVNPNTVSVNSFFTRTTSANAYFYKPIDKKTDEFIISFNSPIVQAFKRSKDEFNIYLYNAQINNKSDFKNAIKNTPLSGMTLDELSDGGYVLTAKIGDGGSAESFLGADGKSIKLILTGAGTNTEKHKSISVKKVEQTPPKPQKLIRKVYFNSEYKAKEPIKELKPLPSIPIISNHSGKKVVVLDAGHGGSDYGAIRAGINEKDINLDVTKRVEAILKSKGVIVYMTRDNDIFVSLQQRCVITAAKNPDIFVSIHVNSCTSENATGLETHYYHEGSIPLAKTVHSSLVSTVKSPDRGLLKNRFYVINHTSIPSILVEIGFISSPKERAELVGEYRKNQTAQAIAEGIIKYLNENK